ncbi:MAG TPA: hypothetical protein VH637_17820 [Streptosporangiaceae bacterium]|jgi:hypothetical protein
MPVAPPPVPPPGDGNQGRDERCGAFSGADVSWPSRTEAWLAGLTGDSRHRGPPDGDGDFADGGAASRMAPGPQLASRAERAWSGGLGRLDDDQLIGLLCGFRRLASWAAAGELAVVAELAARRATGEPDSHLDTEIAAALTLTSRAAARLVDLAAGLTRLPGSAAALKAGQIDAARAAVICDETSVLDDAAAAAVEQRVLPEAPGQTTGQLRAACQRAALAADPQAAIKRRKRAEQDARVETWTETAGTGAIAGRDLPPAEAIAADRRIDTIARWLKRSGAEGTLAQLRARVFTALLSGRDPQELLPGAAGFGGGSTGTDADIRTGPGGGPGIRAGAGEATGLAGLAGSVQLIMPLTAWLGLSDLPGETGGFGPLDAAACRELAARLAAGPSARWCVTLTGPDGRAMAHGCARAGPGPPGSDRARWLRAIKISLLETGPCGHSRETPGYRPSPLLRHLIKIRDRTCAYPTCRRQAIRCDDDHTIAYQQGGRTCECNCAPLCRTHHQAKQAAGWGLWQPSPGTLVWTLPHGRSYRTVPGQYPESWAG